MLTKKPGASVLPTGEHSLCVRADRRPEPGLVLTSYTQRNTGGAGSCVGSVPGGHVVFSVNCLLAPDQWRDSRNGVEMEVEAASDVFLPAAPGYF